MSTHATTSRQNRPGPVRRCREWARRRPARAVVLYALLLIASSVTQALIPRATPGDEGLSRVTVSVPMQTRNGPAPGTGVTLSAIRWHADRSGAPFILLHGSPGDATNFTELAPALERADRPVCALDLPGFGRSDKWVDDYSARACAGYLLAFMDAEGIERAHIVGWSNGGAVALYAADLAPDRVASVTLLAAIACQETEGSGDYFFEHAKYAAGYGALVALPEVLPHFGLLGPRSFRHAFIRNFWDTDQRPVRAIMESLRTPVLILHGRHDPLVSDWAAERHHELIPTSRLVMTAHSHFLPILQPEETAGYITGFIDRHDEAGVPPLTDELVLAPPTGRPWFRGILDNIRGGPWWVWLIVPIPFAAMRRELTTAIAGIFVGHAVVDFGVVFVALFLGRVAAPQPPERRRRLRARLAPTLAWTAFSLLIAQILLGSATGIGDADPITVLGAVLGVAVLLSLLGRLPTRDGRREIVVFTRRWTHHEWWPAWLLYAPVLPRLLRLAIRHRSLTVWTCVNPGIAPGGGIAGEDKVVILDGLDPAHALTQRTIEGTRTGERERAAVALLESGELALPVVVKPVAGERGSGVSIVRTETDLGPALGAFEGPAILQRYHPGPVELGVFWVRDPATVGHEDEPGAQGRIFAITRKIFPELACDGVRTIGEQVLAHPRYRMQAGVFARSLAGRWHDIPPEGERVRLSVIGNHARGCRFEDGSDLITPGLTETIDRLARTWRSRDGKPFDYGRFDIRCASEDDARAGRGVAVIELNGVTSEATALYDPSWSARRALRLLGDQWAVTYELGAARRALGACPLGVFGVLRAVRRA